MSDLNKVFLSGRLARDPELKYTSAGKPYCKFDLAVDRRVQENGEWVDSAVFFNRITLWDKQAENLQRYCRQGDQVFIEGHLGVDEWESDGQKRRQIQITCTNFRLGAKKGTGGRGPQGGDEGEPSPAPRQPAQPARKESAPPRHYEPPQNIEDDDIPF